MTLDPSILLAARILGALVFGTAVFGKLRHRDEFIAVVANYRLLPQRLAQPIAWLIIVCEAVATLSLATAIALRAGAALAIGALSVFAIAMAINLVRGQTQIDCGCFQSALRQKLSVAHIVRNFVLIAALAPLLAADPTPVALLQALDAIGSGVVLFVLYQAFGQMLALRDAAEAARGRSA